MFLTEQRIVEDTIKAYCAENQLPVPDEIQWNPIPFSGEWGISTPLFPLAAQEARVRQEEGGARLNVAQRAQEIASGIAERIGTRTGFSRVEAVKGYLNLYFSPAAYSRRVVDLVLEQGPAFGQGEDKGERVLVEFSQPNTHKAFHVGHLRNVVLGDSVCRILTAAGYEVVRANYINDTGLHVIKWLWNYSRFHAGEKPLSDKTRWMGDLYAEANKRLESDPTLESEVRALYARWDQRDEEVMALWRETRQWSLMGSTKYQMIGVADRSSTTMSWKTGAAAGG
jgi:arginyl-tRNA synthetase